MIIDKILTFVKGLSIPVLVAIGAGILIVVAGIIWYLVARRRFNDLLRRSPEEDAAASAVLQRLSQRPKPKLLRRILEYIPDKALFTIFLHGLENDRIAAELLRWINASEDMFVYRRLALSGRGEEFDGSKACTLFSSHLDHIREMTGDPEWPARYMAVKILLYDDDERSRRAVREMFSDPHTLIRKTIINEYTTHEEKPEKDESEDEAVDFYHQLFTYLTDDPAFEIRKAAKERLVRDYSNKYKVDYSDLSSDQILHLIEQYDTGTTEDIKTALEFLQDDNLEVRFAAGQFLEQTDTLDRLFLDVNWENQHQLDSNRKLLQKALAVKCDNFLENTRKSDNPATLQLAAEILSSYGNISLIPVLADKVFARSTDIPEERGLLEQTVSCIRERGPQEAVQKLARELDKRRYNQEDAALILDHINSSYPFITVPSLLQILKDPSFALREKLHETFLRIDPSYYIDDLFSILKSERDEYAHPVRISALLLLGKLKLSYCMQFLLEQMPILPFEEARDFSVYLKEYDSKLFKDRVLDLLDRDDGKVKAALISAVPATEEKAFLKPIREAVGDADPEVRRAAVWALLEYGDQRSIKESLDLLRDPVERVRMEAARALGAKGKPSVLDSLHEILKDPNEVESVKRAAIAGLAESGEEKSIDILVEQLRERGEELQEETLDALAQKGTKAFTKSLIGHLKDAGPELRERITEAFGRMGEKAEAPLIELLREDIASLKPHIANVLDDTGYIEHTVRKLNHRDPQVRREAAEILSHIGTISAFRGIVLASRDPDEDVRVMVTRALEQLNTESGNEILEQLKNDPDKRIRKYTLWAMERISSKNNE